MPSVLIIASDPDIESLLGQLVAFAGHRPLFDVTEGAAGESIRTIRPDAVLLDTALPPVVVAACMDACVEAGAEPVIVSSAASPEEVEQQAEVLHCHYFALPGGARPMQAVLERALSARRIRPVVAIRADAESVHPAMRAALASVARARLLATHAAEPGAEHARRVELRHTLEEARRGRAALRAAITDYALQLRRKNLPLERIVSIVQDTVADCATTVGAQATMPALLVDAEQWVKSAYHTA